MAQATGAQGVPLISVVAGAVSYSLDDGATWTEAQQPGSPSNSAAPVSGDGTPGTPFTIAAGAIALTKLATQANNTVVGNIAGTASPVALTATQLTALINPATASLPGAMTAAIFGAVQYDVNAVSPLLDMTASGDGVSFSVPVQRAGFYFVPTQSSVVLIGAYTGTASASLIVSAGNDAGHTNAILGSQLTMTSGTLNTFAPFAPLVGVSSAGPSSGVMIDGATEITLKWSAVTGVTAGHFKVVMRGAWIPTT